VARRRKGKRRWLWIVLGLAVLALAALWPMYGTVTASAWHAKAKADTHSLANAVRRFHVHMGRLPVSLDELVQPAKNKRGETMNPVVHFLPTAPGTYTPYKYVRRADGTFTVSTSSSGVEITAP
jgi:hypothetical protein